MTRQVADRTGRRPTATETAVKIGAAEGEEMATGEDEFEVVTIDGGEPGNHGDGGCEGSVSGFGGNAGWGW